MLSRAKNANISVKVATRVGGGQVCIAPRTKLADPKTRTLVQESETSPTQKLSGLLFWPKLYV